MKLTKIQIRIRNNFKNRFEAGFDYLLLHECVNFFFFYQNNA